jgi:hypothetical protein
MENFFSSSDLFDELIMTKLSCCGPVRPCLKDLQQDIWVRVTGDTTTAVEKDK